MSNLNGWRHYVQAAPEYGMTSFKTQIPVRSSASFILSAAWINEYMNSEIALELVSGWSVPFCGLLFFLKDVEPVGAVSLLSWAQQCCFWWLELLSHFYQLHIPMMATKPTQSHHYAPKHWCGFSNSFPGVSKRAELDWKSWAIILRLFSACDFVCGNSSSALGWGAAVHSPGPSPSSPQPPRQGLCLTWQFQNEQVSAVTPILSVLAGSFMHSTWIASTCGLFCNLFLTKLRLVGGGWISPGCSQSITVFRICTRGCGTPKPLCMSLGEGRRGEKWNASSVVLFQRHKCSFTQPGRVFWRPYPWLSYCQTSYHSSTVHCRAWVI